MIQFNYCERGTHVFARKDRPHDQHALQWNPYPQIDRSPLMAAEACSVDGGPDVDRQERDEKGGRRQRSHPPTPRDQQGDCESPLEDSRSEDGQVPHGKPGGQHVDHAFGFHEMTHPGESKDHGQTNGG